MKNIFVLKLLPLPLLCLFLLSHCASYRGIPGHGGGKRFDEEQLAVAAAIRHAGRKMDFSRLRTRRVSLEVTSLETSGAGDPTYAGMGTFTPFVGEARDDRDLVQRQEATNSDRLYTHGHRTYRRLADAEQDIEMSSSYATKKTVTAADVFYLERVLEMRLRHDGFQIVPAEMAEAHIVVLISALGTNTSRKDYAVAVREDLAGTCSMTYYTMDPVSQNIITANRAVASKSTYYERAIRMTPFSKHKRRLSDFKGSVVPTFDIPSAKQ